MKPKCRSNLKVPPAKDVPPGATALLPPSLPSPRHATARMFESYLRNSETHDLYLKSCLRTLLSLFNLALRSVNHGQF